MIQPANLNRDHDAVDRDNPWPGLAPFTESQREFFYGRESESAELLRRVRGKMLTVLFGQSGLGKTSLLCAGLFPRLREEEMIPVLVRLNYDSAAPLPSEQVFHAFAEAIAAGQIDAPMPSLGGLETLWEYFHRRNLEFWTPRNRPATLVLVFDQFEEIYTLGRLDEPTRERARKFLVELADLLENRPPAALRSGSENQASGADDEAPPFDFSITPCKVVLSLREDYLPDLEGMRKLAPSISENRMRLQAMNGRQALDVLCGAGGRLIDHATAAQVVHFVANSTETTAGTAARPTEVGESDVNAIQALQVEPALLSIFAHELNRKRQAQGLDRITPDLLAGQRDQIISDFYDRCLADLPAGARPFIEDRLLTPSGFRDSLAMELATGPGGLAREVIDRLVARRLLHVDQRLGTQRLELTHDVLTGPVRASRDARIQREALDRAERRERETRAQLSLVRRRLVFASVLVLVMLGLAVFSILSWRRAEQERSRAEKERVRAEAEGARAELSAKVADGALEDSKKALVETERQKSAAQASATLALEQSHRAEVANTQVELERDRALKAEKEASANAGEARAERNKAEGSRARAEEQRVKLEELMKFMLSDLGDRLRPLGRVDLLQSVAQKVTDYYELLPAGRDESSRFDGFKILAYARALQGDSAGATKALTNALAIAKQLAAEHPGDTNWQCKLLLCHQSIGEILQAQGNSEQALDEYGASLAIARQLTNQEPAVMEWQRLCLANHVKIGDVWGVQGNRRQTLTNHEAAVRIAVRLAAQYDQSITNPAALDNELWLPTLNAIATVWQDDLSVSQSPTGPLLLQIWGWDKAYQGCRQWVEVAQALVGQHRGDPLRQSHLALCHDNLGDVLFVTNRFEEARQHYQQAKEIRQRLADADSANTERQHDLLRSYFKLDRVIVAQSQKSKAAAMVGMLWDAPIRCFWEIGKTYQGKVMDIFIGDRGGKAIANFSPTTNVAQRLANSDPSNAVWRDALAQSHSLMGDLFQRAGKREEAVREHREALLIREELAARDTNAMEPQLWVALSHGKLATTLKHLSEPDQSLLHVRTNLETFSALIGRWPKNFLFLKEPRPGEKNLGDKVPMSRDQVRDVGEVFSNGFARARKLARKASATPKELQDWAGFCSERAVVETFFGDIANAVEPAEDAAEVWQREFRKAPNDGNCRAHLRQALVALGAFHICNRQFQAAVGTALRGIELEPTSVDLKAILVLSHCLIGDFEKAAVIVRENKDLSVGRNLSFPEAIVDDLHRLRDRGLTDLDVERIDKLLAAAGGNTTN